MINYPIFFGLFLCAVLSLWPSYALYKQLKPTHQYLSTIAITFNGGCFGIVLVFILYILTLLKYI